MFWKKVSIIYSNLTPLNIEGQIRKFEKFQRNNKNHIAVGINNEKVELLNSLKKYG